MKKLPNNRGLLPLFMFICLSFSTALWEPVKAGQFVVPPQATVSGIVTDTDGLPLAGVHIQVESTKKGTISDLDGAFEIEAGPDDELVFSIMGFKSLRFPIAGRHILNVQMEQDVTQLGEVVLNAGYYTVKERERTGSIVAISSKDLETQPVTNPISALQGRMTGVNVTQSTGVPGGGFNIQIRGQNSISAGTAPLYVVDGVPYSSETLGYPSAFAQIMISGISPLNNLNQNDIESIEVLKDADATAIYGSRGSNGVVLITTKTGTIEKTKVSIKMRQGLGKVASKLKLLNTPQYLELRTEAFENDGIAEYPSNAYDINGTWDRNRNTDWQKELIGGTAYTTDIHGSVTGGNAKTQFLLSGNYYKTGSVFPDDGYFKKAGAHTSIGHTSSNEKFKVNFSADYTTNLNTISSTDLTFNALILPPNAPKLHNNDGSLNWENGTWTNPLSQTFGVYRADQSNFVANTILSYRLDKAWEIKSSFGYTQTLIEETRTAPHTTFSPTLGFTSSFSGLFLNQGNRRSWIIEPQISWEKKYNSHGFKVLMGGTFQENTSKRVWILGRGFSSNSLINNLAAANTIIIQDNTRSVYNYAAVFGRFNYTLHDRYMINGTWRYDGSSRFGPGNQFANFGAIGVGWLFRDEPAATDFISSLSYGKLRASYGTTGNDQIGDYQFYDSYQVDNTPYDGINGLEPTRLFNPDFGWERNTKLNFGLDMGYFNDRIFLSIEYYRNRTTNQLVGIPMPLTTGFNRLHGNLMAEVENSGWEFGLHTLNSSGIGNEFRWTTDFNISFNRNKLIDFPDLEASPYANSLVIGKPLNILKTYKFMGISDQTGAYSFEDYNKDGAISSTDDRQFLVDLTPRFHGGVTNNLSWNNLACSFSFAFVKQYKANVFNGSAYPGFMYNQSTYVLDHWPNDGSDALVQRYTTGANSEANRAASLYRLSNRAYSDASFLRLKNIELSYKFPDGLFKGTDIFLFIQGQNLWTLTSYMGLDPETPPNTLPPLTEVLLGFQLNF